MPYLCFVNCCTLLATEGCQIIYYFSWLNRLISCCFIMSKMSTRKTSWKQDQIKDRYDPRSKHNQQKSEHSKCQQSWGVQGCSEPLSFFFLGFKEHLEWFKIDLNATKIIMYLSMRIHSKSCPIFTQKVAATLLKSSRKGAVVAQWFGRY